MGKASDIWNAQTLEKRKELRGIMIEQGIRDLNISKQAMIRGHKKALNEINQIIKFRERELARWEKGGGSLTHDRA